MSLLIDSSNAPARGKGRPWNATPLWASLAVVLCTACSTVPDPYRPATVGPIGASTPVEGLELAIEPVSEAFVFGEPISFRVILANVGDEAFWVPRKPEIRFYWIYPTGKRDNYVRERAEAAFLQDTDVVLLKPGFRLIYVEHIKTHYFPRPGIMEFRARYTAAPNLNPAIDSYWSGSLISNTYGVSLN